MNGQMEEDANCRALLAAVLADMSVQDALMYFHIAPRRHKTTGEKKRRRDAEIVLRYTQGQEHAQIMEALGIGRQTVYNALARAGVSLRKRRPNAPRRDEMVRRYRSGETAAAIAADMKLALSTVYKALHAAGAVKDR